MFFTKHTLTTLTLLLALSFGFSVVVEAQERSRSLMKKDMTARDIIVTFTPQEQSGSEVSLFFPIEFALDSAKLNEDAVKTLAKIGVALQSPELANMTLIVEGHTDASGSAEYNRALSLRRAKSAASFLQSVGVAGSRLKVVGRGEDDPIENENPYAAKQRRVELVRVF